MTFLRKGAFAAVLVLSCLLLQSFTLQGSKAARKPVDKLRKYSLVLGAQAHKTSGGFVDLSRGDAMQVTAAAARQSDIDFVYVFGATTGINLITPSSSRLDAFSSYKRTVSGRWTTLNKGRLINVLQDKASRQLFKKVKTREDIAKAFTEAQKRVKEFPDYSVGTHGPAISLRNVQVGDVFIFKSSDKNIYAIGRVVNHQTGFGGTIQLDLKVSSR